MTIDDSSKARRLPAIHTIPPGVPFVDALAAGVMAQVGSDPLDLAGVTILLPTRRACRSLRDAFLRLSGGRPRLLPRMSPLGDIDADALSLGQEELPGVAAALDLPPAISGLRRQLLLARAILRVPGMSATTDQAARLAADLARLLDQVYAEGLSFAGLAGLVPDDYAEHWQITLKFLTLLTDHWPGVLAEEGVLDLADRRNRMLQAQAAAWRANPPAGLVIAAGATATIPAIIDLLTVVAGLPQGALVLAGLDQECDDASWNAVDESHPQYGHAGLLRHLGVARAQVRPWPAERRGTHPARARLIGETMRPAATTEGWRALEPDGTLASGLDGLVRIDCPGPQEEAGVIALMMRQALETPEKTVALVTLDRTLARRVASVLARWGITADDSGGQPLGSTAIGSYLRLTARVAAERAAPVTLLSLLKHPLAAAGREPWRFRALIRALERAILRGPRPGDGFDGLEAALIKAEDKRFDWPEARARLLGWVEEMRGLAAPLTQAMNGAAPLTELVDAHVRFVEALAATHDQPGPERLWRRDDGEAAARFIDELRRAAKDFPDVAGPDYPGLLEALMAPRSVWPRFGVHPRLHILGPLEARLQHFDLMILAGLNEGCWPPVPPADPWLSRPMRQTFGLPAPELQIGMTAHDFAQSACAPEVVLTRAERIEGTPTVPSRWLLRLDTVLRAVDLEGRIGFEAEQWLAWARALDEPDAVRPVSAPTPRPPVAARPRKLSVTEIETWMRDPYAIYARRVLRLSPLDPIAADPGAAERGQFIHQALDAFVRAHPGVLPGNALEELLRFGRDAFGDLLAQPDVWAFWWPRFERVAAWFVDRERDRRLTIQPLATEIGGSIELDGPAGPFTLTAKADRIDRLPDNRLLIIDYKTGTPPTGTEIELGFAPQLSLEATIAESGGFTGVPAAVVGGLAFWKLSGGDPAGEERPVKAAVATLAEAAHEGLERLIWEFDKPETPYRSQPRPDRAPRFSDYAHLARVQEWSAGGEGGGE